MPHFIFVTCFIIIIGLIGILYLSDIFNLNKPQQAPQPSVQQKQYIPQKRPIKLDTYSTTPYIKPTPFEIGNIKTLPYKVADNCNTVLYPINPLYVNYGPYEGNCDTNIFNQPY